MNIVDVGIATPRAIGTVVFCHGFPGTNLNEPLARALSTRDLRSVLFRYSGVGGTAGTWSFDRSATECAEVLRAARAEGPSPIVALGYSLGAFHVSRALRSDPSLADALVLLGPVLSLATFRAQLGSNGSSAERFISEGRGLIGGDGDERIAQYRRLEQEEQPLSFLRSVPLPTLLIHGTSDTVVPGEDVRIAVAAMRDATALIVKDDHNYARTAETIADAICLRVKSVRAGGRSA